MYEREGMVTRLDLYRCAKAMGGWSEKDGKPFHSLVTCL